MAGLRQHNEDAEELDPGWLHGLVRAALPQCRAGLHGAAQRPGAPEDTGETRQCTRAFGCTVTVPHMRRGGLGPRGRERQAGLPPRTRAVLGTQDTTGFRLLALKSVFIRTPGLFSVKVLNQGSGLTLVTSFHPERIS